MREALASAGGAAAPGEPEPERRPAAEGTAAAGAADTAGTVRGRSTEDASGEEPDTEPGPGADDTEPSPRADDTEAADVQGGRGAEGDSGGAGGPAPTGRVRGRRAAEPPATGVRAAGASGEGPEVGGPGRPGGRGVEGDSGGAGGPAPTGRARGRRAAEPRATAVGAAGAPGEGPEVGGPGRPGGRGVEGDSGGAGGPAPTDRARGRRAAEPPATGVRAAGASGEGPAVGGPGRPAGPAPADADRRAAQAVATPSSGWAPADMGAPATFVLLRHGETPLTPQKRFSGSGGSDPSLSDIGREQAGKVAAALARRGTVQAVVASPLARTRETARIVAARLGLDVAVEDGLRETDFGAWEGLTFGEVRERYPEDLDAWLASPDAEPTGGGESFAATAARVAEARDRLLAEYRGRTVLLVTHVTPIKMMIRLALGAPPEALFRMELSAASLSAVAYYADGNASVRLFNDTSHLR
ncbi:bifunctional RNase H/acid phosphatase [Streptomyces sp. SudanB148_2056]|uniref:bifunctional RNase H/acid phosphatase n=1 Tax=Streptomyces sp. SudanB148_2056 TaxID=3035280 RepID=UPI003F563401